MVRFVGSTDEFGFELTLDKRSLAPGGEGSGRLLFWAAEAMPDVSVGDTFEVCEGTRVIGSGVVVDVNMG